MEEAFIIAGLLAKREQIGKRIIDLRKQATKHKAEIVQIDAAMALFATDVTAAWRKASRFARSEHFASGELTRRYREEFRRSPEPVTADDLAVAAMRDKGLDPADAAVRGTSFNVSFGRSRGYWRTGGFGRSGADRRPNGRRR